MMPWSSQTGVPIHFHSSTTSGSAFLMTARILASISPRQSPSSSMRASMSSDGDAFCFALEAFDRVFFFMQRAEDTPIADPHRRLWFEVEERLVSWLSKIDACTIQGSGHLLQIQEPGPVARA